MSVCSHSQPPPAGQSPTVRTPAHRPHLVSTHCSGGMAVREVVGWEVGNYDGATSASRVHFFCARTIASSPNPAGAFSPQVGMQN